MTINHLPLSKLYMQHYNKYVFVTKHPDNIPQYHILMRSPKDSITSNANTNVNSTSKTISSKKQLFIDSSKPFISMRLLAKSLPRNKSICLCVTDIPQKYKYSLLTYISKRLYTFQKYVSQSDEKSLKEFKVYIFDKVKQDKNSKVLQRFVCCLNCADVARDLENEPANVMSPSVFVSTTKAILQDAIAKSGPTAPNLKIHVLDEMS